MTTGCLHQPEIIAGESPHMMPVATATQLFPHYAVVVCLIDREAASIALNATGQDGINMETLYQASTEQTWSFVTPCTRQMFMRTVSSSIFHETTSCAGPWHLVLINARSEAGSSVIVHHVHSTSSELRQDRDTILILILACVCLTNTPYLSGHALVSWHCARVRITTLITDQV